jgi:hypothetical protein
VVREQRRVDLGKQRDAHAIAEKDYVTCHEQILKDADWDDQLRDSLEERESRLRAWRVAVRERRQRKLSLRDAVYGDGTLFVSSLDIVFANLSMKRPSSHADPALPAYDELRGLSAMSTWQDVHGGRPSPQSYRSTVPVIDYVVQSFHRSLPIALWMERHSALCSESYQGHSSCILCALRHCKIDFGKMLGQTMLLPKFALGCDPIRGASQYLCCLFDAMRAREVALGHCSSDDGCDVTAVDRMFRFWVEFRWECVSCKRKSMSFLEQWVWRVLADGFEAEEATVQELYLRSCAVILIERSCGPCGTHTQHRQQCCLATLPRVLLVEVDRTRASSADSSCALPVLAEDYLAFPVLGPNLMLTSLMFSFRSACACRSEDGDFWWFEAGRTPHCVGQSICGLLKSKVCMLAYQQEALSSIRSGRGSKSCSAATAVPASHAVPAQFSEASLREVCGRDVMVDRRVLLERVAPYSSRLFTYGMYAEQSFQCVYFDLLSAEDIEACLFGLEDKRNGLQGIQLDFAWFVACCRACRVVASEFADVRTRRLASSGLADGKVVAPGMSGDRQTAGTSAQQTIKDGKRRVAEAVVEGRRHKRRAEQRSGFATLFCAEDEFSQSGASSAHVSKDLSNADVGLNRSGVFGGGAAHDSNAAVTKAPSAKGVLKAQGDHAASSGVRVLRAQQSSNTDMRAHAGSAFLVTVGSATLQSTALYGKLVALFLDEEYIVVPLLAEMRQVFGDSRARELAQSAWLVAWPRWEVFAEEVLVAAGRSEDFSITASLNILAMRELLFALQRFLIARDKDRPSDQMKLRSLQAMGFKWAHGEVWGRNNCLADSLLQLLIKHGLIRQSVDRRAACKANRVALESQPSLVPRRADGRLDLGGYLQHHRHAEAIIRFFFDRFRCRAADLPAAGFVVYCHANYDDNDHPPDQVLVCEGLGVRVGPPLHFHLFNWVGSGCDGYHYDPLWLTNAALDLTVADASGDVQQEVNTAPLLPPAASASGPTIPGSATAGTGVTFAQAGPDHVPADPPRPVRRRIGQQIDRRRLLQRRRSMADDVCDELPLSFVQLVLSDTENDGADNVGLPRVRRVLRRAESEVSIGAADDLLATRLADAFTPGDLGACSEVTASETSLPRASEGTSASLSLRQGDSSERPRWKQFTPERIDQTGRICLARVWGSGRGAQCSRSPQQQELVSGLCVMHERERVKFGVPRHGFIHDDIPHEKWVDFVKAAGKCQRDHL